MAEKLYHFHAQWTDRHAEPKSHVLCLTAVNEMHATRETGRYIGESLGSIESITRKGDAASYIFCDGK